MPDDAKTDRLVGYAPPEPERVSAVLFAAFPGRPGELVMQLFLGGRLIELSLSLSAGDRVSLAEALAAVPERASRSVSRDETVRTQPAEPDGG